MLHRNNRFDDSAGVKGYWFAAEIPGRAYVNEHASRRDGLRRHRGRRGFVDHFSQGCLPILQKNCQTGHRPREATPMVFLTYKDVRPWAKAIRTAVILRKMPPWLADPLFGHFLNDRSLKQSEIETIVKWADAGAPEGDRRQER